MTAQLSLLDGINRKDEGISRVEQNALGFVEIMRGYAIECSDNMGWVTSDELRVYADRHGIRPHHKNAWGAVFRGRNWKVIGRKQSEYPDNHAREIKIWKWEVQ